tara:strand:- start:4329 stop:5939 length:1611 start_codon:yes stop_codon:yes gene_type:complete
MFNLGKKEREKLKIAFGEIKDGPFDFEMIEKYFRDKDNFEVFQILSDKTCDDLDFDEMFCFLDRTNSRIGQQFLYNRLRTISSNRINIERNEEIISRLAQDEDFRVKIQKELTQLNDFKAYYVSSLFQEEHISPPKYFFIFRLLSFTSILLLALLPFNPQIIFALIGVFVINLGIHFWNKKNLFKYLQSIPQLLRLNRIASSLHKEGLFKKINPNLNRSIKIINQLRNRMLFFQLEGKLQGDLAVIFWSTFELIKTLFLLEPILLFAVLKRLNTKRNEIEAVFTFIGEVDSLISIASLRKGSELFCMPKISEEDNTIIAEELYHPLIQNCVTNNISVLNKSVLLTGSNMSGKTTFIRSIGLNLITGLTINTCFAKAINLPIIRIYSAIRISDDLMNDKSYYFEEVLTIKEMLEKSRDGKPSLFLLDEIFKGTNTIERIAGGKATLSYLAQNNNVVFVSTHDTELTDMLIDSYELYHFSELIDSKSVDFDFKLKTGKLKNRNAIKILQINQYPEEVISEALEISIKLDMKKDNKELN